MFAGIGGYRRGRIRPTVLQRNAAPCYGIGEALTEGRGRLESRRDVAAGRRQGRTVLQRIDQLFLLFVDGKQSPTLLPGSRDVAKDSETQLSGSERLYIYVNDNSHQEQGYCGVV